MNKDEKRQFIKDLLDSTRDDILARVDAMPDEWDGREIRCYVADKFQEKWRLKLLGSARLKEYVRECARNMKL